MLQPRGSEQVEDKPGSWVGDAEAGLGGRGLGARESGRQSRATRHIPGAPERLGKRRARLAECGTRGHAGVPPRVRAVRSAQDPPFTPPDGHQLRGSLAHPAPCWLHYPPGGGNGAVG